MSSFEDSAGKLREVGKLLGLDAVVVDKIIEPDRVVKKKISIIGDNGRKKTFHAYRSQHSNLLGPYKGGIRFHHDVSEDEVKALSLWMSLKTAIAGVPYGGGKGGVAVDPNNLSLGELELVSKEYVRQLGKNFGPWKDVPAPDVNTNSQVMAWMVDAYREYLQKEGLDAFTPAHAGFTGKPVEIGGSQGREEATGLGGFYVLEEYVKKIERKPSTVKIAIQGFGNVSYWFAYFAYKAGYTIVGLSNSKGAAYSKNGFDPERIIKAMSVAESFEKIISQKLVSSREGFDLISNDELLSLDVDVLVPAALGGVIHKDNVCNINSKIILELANGPVTKEAESQFLKSPGNILIPDVLANAGGVVVSYFEWAQNLSGWYWEKELVFERLKKIMTEAFNRVWEEHIERKVSMKQAAYLVALQKLAVAQKLRGGLS